MSKTENHTLPFVLPPDGTVTFLFTDIEGSTLLLSKLRKKYASLLSKMRRIVREILSRRHGHEIGTEGDSFSVAFPRATDAVIAAVEIQRSLAESKWPEDVSVRLRIGIHTGEPWVDEEGYTGIDVHRASRITSSGHGGQVLLSETTSALAREELPRGVSLLDLGFHRLKDLDSPEHIRQLVIPDLPSEFPPLNSLTVAASDQNKMVDFEFVLQTLDEAGFSREKIDPDKLLWITTFGGLNINLGKKSVTGFSSPKVEAILVYLAYNRRSFKQLELAELFWGGRSQTHALSNLKMALVNLEKVLGEYMIEFDDPVELNPQAACWLDVTVLEKMVAERKVGSIVRLHQGLFLEGFQVRTAQAFNEWCTSERRRWEDILQNIAGKETAST